MTFYYFKIKVSSNPQQPFCFPQEATRSHKKPQEATRSHKKPQEATRSHKKPQKMSDVKNFVVSFRNNSIMDSNIKNNIIDIMIAINSCPDFETAKKEKIPRIRDFINSDKRIIDYMIMLYGVDLVMKEYQERFGEIVYSPILTLDFATLILDNIIVICEYNSLSLDEAFVDSRTNEDLEDPEDPEYPDDPEYPEDPEYPDDPEDRSVSSPIINEILREISGLSDRSFTTVSSLTYD
jgi:hypothetical protein